MKIDTADQGTEELTSLLGEGRITVIRTRRGKWVNPAFKISRSVNEAQVELYRDNNWRWSYYNTYGKTGFVYGSACDASGFVVADPTLLARINDIAEWIK